MKAPRKKSKGTRTAAPRKKAAPRATKTKRKAPAKQSKKPQPPAPAPAKESPAPGTTPRPPGRPSGYREEFPLQAEKLCRLLGATDEALAKFFEVSVATLNTWKKKHPEFLEALKRGKDPADAEVANALYRRALGFAHPAVKIFADAKSGETVTVPYVERYPPDTTACIFWLKNRQPEAWRDRHEHTGKNGAPLHPPSKDEALTGILDRLAQVAEQGEKGRAAVESAGLPAPG